MTKSDLVVQENSQPTRADALKNRALILKTAARLFAERSVEDVLIQDIADAAEVGKGTFYRNFPNGKPDLCLALLDEDQRDLQERSLAHLRTHGNPTENLRWFLVEVLHFVDRNADLLRVGGELASTLEHPAHWWWRQTIRGLLGQANPSGDLDYLADVLYVLLDIRTILFQSETQGYSMERITDGLLLVLDKIFS